MRPISMDEVDKVRVDMLSTICSPVLTHEQKVSALAHKADSLLRVLDLPEGLAELCEKGIICDLNEGNAPGRPRYIVPDYGVLFEKGCEFLRLAPPQDLHEAINSLLILYKHVPSVTNFPVFIGNIDTLLEPFVQQTERGLAKKLLGLFLTNIDRTITDAFCHANLGPVATLTGELVLELEREMQNAVPNMTMLYDPLVTPDAFAIDAIRTQLSVSKPAFANHSAFKAELGKYAIASCYNSLKLGGGAFTLVRVKLGALAQTANGSRHFFAEVLPHCLRVMAAYMDVRTKFIAEDSGFFQNSFLAREGFISRDLFSSMFGMVGLAECVNTLMQKDRSEGRYGHSANADELGVKVLEEMKAFVNNHENKYCTGFNNRFMLHGQVGIDTDTNETPNVRIPIGEEPEELAEHILHCAKFQPYFPSGVGEIFPVESTALSNPAAVLDIIKGAFANNVRYLTIHNSDSDVIRVTGYLVKRSEVEKLKQGDRVLQNTTIFGLGAVNNSKVLERKLR